MTDNINEKEIAPEQQNPEEVKSVSEQQEGIVTESNVMKKKDINTVSKKQVVGKVFVQIGLYLFLTFMALVVLFPFYW
ncbi:MAG: hypothetical protein K2N74_05265, partial [Clostridiales bacterium]|nr:hypothetical protein [Clostridiales bacterium]